MFGSSNGFGTGAGTGTGPFGNGQATSSGFFAQKPTSTPTNHAGAFTIPTTVQTPQPTNSQAGGLFGAAQSSASGQGSVFGNPSQQSASSSLFGQPTGSNGKGPFGFQNNQNRPGGLFGPSNSTDIFGNGNQTQFNNGPFLCGAASSSTTPFGNVTQNSHGAFGHTCFGYVQANNAFQSSSCSSTGCNLKHGDQFRWCQPQGIRDYVNSYSNAFMILPKFTAVKEHDGSTSHYQDICFVQPFTQLSREEIRLIDYQEGRKFFTAHAPFKSVFEVDAKDAEILQLKSQVADLQSELRKAKMSFATAHLDSPQWAKVPPVLLKGDPSIPINPDPRTNNSGRDFRKKSDYPFGGESLPQAGTVLDGVRSVSSARTPYGDPPAPQSKVYVDAGIDTIAIKKDMEQRFETQSQRMDNIESQLAKITDLLKNPPPTRIEDDVSELPNQFLESAKKEKITAVDFDNFSLAAPTPGSSIDTVTLFDEVDNDEFTHVPSATPKAVALKSDHRSTIVEAFEVLRVGTTPSSDSKGDKGPLLYHDLSVDARFVLTVFRSCHGEAGAEPKTYDIFGIAWMNHLDLRQTCKAVEELVEHGLVEQVSGSDELPIQERKYLCTTLGRKIGLDCVGLSHK